MLNFVPGINPGFLKALRTARVLRPLKSISKLRAMRLLLVTIISSITGLVNVCIFLVFVFGIFAIMGLHTLSGKQYQFCRSTEEMIDDGVNTPFWPINPDAEWLCHKDEMCSGYPNYLGDDAVAKCGSVYDVYGLDSREIDNTQDMELIVLDTFNFNNIF